MVHKVCRHASRAVGGGWGGGKPVLLEFIKVQITKQVTLSVVVIRRFIL